MTFSTGAKYQGSFREGVYEGQGTMFYANGDIYTGDWAAGLKHGAGCYLYKATGARLQGTWVENVLASGVFTDKFGNAYSGAFGSDGASAIYAPGGNFTLASGASAAIDDKAAMLSKLEMVTAGFQGELSALFKAIDADGDGSLDTEELRVALHKYMGVAAHQFDAQAMLKVFDTHGTPDGRIDEDEFRWYMADWAMTMRENWDPDNENQGDVVGAIAVMPEVIADFQAIVGKL